MPKTVSICVAAGVLQTTPDKIRIHAMQMGGAFGRRTVFARELLRDALLLSKISQRPVKLMWTREDDVRNGWFRPASAHRISASLDENGNVTGYHHRLASPSVLQFALPQIWEKTNGRDLLVMEGAQAQDYDFPNLTAEHVVTERQSKIAAWRCIGWGPICYARECFIDELAAAANSDPVSFRRKLLVKSNRGLAVLNKVLEMSDFGNAPEGRAHGLSFAGYKGTRGAGVAEISLDLDTNEPRFHKFWAAIDPGIAVHPKNVAAQVEGGVIFGLSGLHRERISVTDGQVDQSNFYDYEILRANEVPEVFVEIIQSGAAPSGVGEIGVPMTGGAVANALFALTGSRPHNMPFNAHL